MERSSEYLHLHTSLHVEGNARKDTWGRGILPRVPGSVLGMNWTSSGSGGNPQICVLIEQPFASALACPVLGIRDTDRKGICRGKSMRQCPEEHRHGSEWSQQMSQN